jgi:GNAT superfamily N-acetyltransferase
MPVFALEPDDWQRKRHLRLSALAESPASYGSTYAREEHRTEQEWRTWPHPGVCFVATRDGVDVGSACGWLMGGDPDTTNLIAMWVAPEARGQRLAAELIDAVVAWARQHGSRRVELEVAGGNEAGVKTYLRYGFQPSNREPNKPGGIPLHYPLT